MCVTKKRKVSVKKNLGESTSEEERGELFGKFGYYILKYSAF